MILAPPQEGQCAICRRAESGVGYAPPGRRKKGTPLQVTWCCKSDIELGRAVHHLPQDILSRIERESVSAAGDDAGAYLDKIGKTDLATLSREEWEEFLNTFLNGFGEHMRKRLATETAPF